MRGWNWELMPHGWTLCAFLATKSHNGYHHFSAGRLCTPQHLQPSRAHIRSTSTHPTPAWALSTVLFENHLCRFVNRRPRWAVSGTVHQWCLLCLKFWGNCVEWSQRPFWAQEGWFLAPQYGERHRERLSSCSRKSSRENQDERKFKASLYHPVIKVLKLPPKQTLQTTAQKRKTNSLWAQCISAKSCLISSMWQTSSPA